MDIIVKNILKKARWLTLNEINYKDKSGRTRQWEYAERNNGTLAAVIIPIDKKSKSVLLIKQYRLPFEKEVIEFPAGLVDPGESPQTCALRELTEETGLKALRVISRSPLVCSSAGLTTESFYFFEVEVDLSTRPGSEAQNLSPSEIIHVIPVPFTELLPALNRYAAQGCVIDSKVWAYAYGLNSNKEYPKSGV